MTPSYSGKLECQPNVCRVAPGFRKDIVLQLFPHRFDYLDPPGSCYPIGSPCFFPTQVLGYNVFERRGECVDLLDSRTQYHTDPEVNALLDDFYNSPETEMQETPMPSDRQYARPQRRAQQSNNKLFQSSISVPEAILNSCQPGGQTGTNFKCTHPVV